MTSSDDPVYAALDAYIRSQLARAAEVHASHTDLEVRLAAVLAAGRNDDDDSTAVANS